MNKTLLATIVVLLGGCTGASHLSDAHGRSYHAVWRAQATAPTGQVQAAVKGLDSEEATIVASSYRASLAPKGAKTEEEPQILYVAPPRRGERQTPLAPSVPKE